MPSRHNLGVARSDTSSQRGHHEQDAQPTPSCSSNAYTNRFLHGLYALPSAFMIRPELYSDALPSQQFQQGNRRRQLNPGKAVASQPLTAPASAMKPTQLK